LLIQDFINPIHIARASLLGARLDDESMEYVRLGRTGMKVPRICLGCWSFGNQSEWMIEIDKRALESLVSDHLDASSCVVEINCLITMER